MADTEIINPHKKKKEEKQKKIKQLRQKMIDGSDLPEIMMNE